MDKDKDKDIFYYYDLEEKSHSLKRFDDVLLARKKIAEFHLIDKEYQEAWEDYQEIAHLYLWFKNNPNEAHSAYWKSLDIKEKQK